MAYPIAFAIATNDPAASPGGPGAGGAEAFPIAPVVEDVAVATAEQQPVAIQVAEAQAEAQAVSVAEAQTETTGGEAIEVATATPEEVYTTVTSLTSGTSD